MSVQFYTDPGEFLGVAGPALAADPIVSTVIATTAVRGVREGVLPDQPYWFATVQQGGELGLAMRTASFAPYPLYLNPMTRAAAYELADALIARGEPVTGVNGSLPAARECAERWAAAVGGRIEVAQHTRLFRLAEVIPPPPVPGRLVPAEPADVELLTRWLTDFGHDADRQAGRGPGTGAYEAPTPQQVLQRVSRCWFWVDESGDRVHLTGVNPPSYGVSRIGPVYTPPAQQGRGWASAAVAEVAARLRAEGSEVTLFTDQANPVSNRIYQRLGFVAVVDMANHAYRAGDAP